MSTLFYSQVNSALQKELYARGSTGTPGTLNSNRTTKEIDFMVGKLANVEIRAYSDQPTVNSVPLSGYGTLGGVSVLTGGYMPNSISTGDIKSPVGFLNNPDRISNRIPPVITSVTIGIQDTSKNYINTATISIVIPDGTVDLDELESIYGIPGRYIQVQIAHPDDVVITNSLLSDEGLPTTETIKSFFPDIDYNTLKKMNEVFFSGRISNFSYNYNADGSIEFSVEAIGISNTYAEVQLVIQNEPKQQQSGTAPKNEVFNIYTLLNDEIELKITTEKQRNPNISEFEYIEPGTTDQGILIGHPYTTGNTNSPSLERMISLGYLLNYLNLNVLNSVGTSAILCNDTLCKSNFYERLVSSDPINILLWSGKSAIKSDVYTFNLSVEPAVLQKSKLQMIPNVQAVSEGFSVRKNEINESYPSRIYINLKIIKSIFDQIQQPDKYGMPDPTVRNFLNKLSEVIRKHTGDAIKLALVQDADIPEALLFYDTNFVSSNKQVNEFILPAFATKTGRSIVRELSLNNQLPNDVKNMLFTFSTPLPGIQKQVSLAPWVYSIGERRKEFEEQWKINHIAAVESLEENSNTFAKRPTDPEVMKRLQFALTQYVTYFTPDIRNSINTNKVTFPLELEFTIDGINGFKFGDVLNFDGIPKRYSETFVFSVSSIVHSVSNDGEWTTKINCLARVKAS